jgi:hypothetical protein
VVQEDQAKEEELACKWESVMRAELALQWEVEPPEIDSWPYFSGLWEEEVRQSLESSLILDRQWIESQLDIMERQLVYFNPHSSTRTATYREWVRATVKATGNPNWARKPLPMAAVRRKAPAPPSSNKKATNPPPPPKKDKPAAPPAPPKKTGARPAPVASTRSDEMAEAHRSGKIGDDMLYDGWFEEDPQVFGHEPHDVAEPAIDPTLEYRDAQTGAPRNRPTLAVFKRVCETVYSRIDAHIFDKCGWKLDEKEDTFVFTNPGAVKEGIYVGDIPNVRDVLLTMDMIDDQDQWVPNEPVDGFIRGAITKNKELPIYKLRLRSPKDTIVRRAVIAQDPSKPSWCGRKANDGHHVTWITNDPPSGGKKRWIRFILDGKHVVCNKNR